MKVLRIDMSRCDAGRDCNHECEEACAVKVFKLDDPERATLHIREGSDGHGVAFICDQCGDCIEVCPTNALTRNRMGVVVIDKKICVGCLMCIGFCDKDIFERAPGMIEPYKCISCGICVKVCPHAALEIVDVPATAKPATATAAATTSAASEERV